MHGDMSPSSYCISFFTRGTYGIILIYIHEVNQCLGSAASSMVPTIRFSHSFIPSFFLDGRAHDAPFLSLEDVNSILPALNRIILLRFTRNQLVFVVRALFCPLELLQTSFSNFPCSVVAAALAVPTTLV